jgi:hypothetical protein
MTKKMKNIRRRIIEETDMGLYIWTVNGSPVGDDQGNYLSVPAVKGDVKTINKFRDVVYGYMRDMGMEPSGTPVFLAGRRQITDEEYEEQISRQKFGLIPDPLDYAAINEDLKFKKQQGLI